LSYRKRREKGNAHREKKRIAKKETGQRGCEEAKVWNSKFTEALKKPTAKKKRGKKQRNKLREKGDLPPSPENPGQKRKNQYKPQAQHNPSTDTTLPILQSIP